MNFQLCPEEAAFLSTVRDFVNAEVLPNTRIWEKNEVFPDEIWPRLGQLGLLKMVLPREQGGVSCSAYIEVCREVAKGDPALAMNIAAVNALCVGHVDKFGTPEQKVKYMDGMASGKVKLAWGLTEPDAGSDARRVKTVAEAIPGRPGYFKLNGTKKFITNAGKADLIIMIANVDSEFSKDGKSAFLVETNQPGFTNVTRINTVGVSASYTTGFDLIDAVG
ncbi:MAG: acyl-CoA dehydrogenase family protein, partial [Armatimonadetes bacterium]|nr:acyl-CoA dehydrogenase family protein [Armatimonadota bacterium]